MKTLHAEVEEYAEYLAGNVYGYEVLDEDGNDIESCWGFIGDYECGALEEARGVVNRIVGSEPFRGAGI